MTYLHREGGCSPTRSQELLLRAAILQGRDALNAWHAWKLTTDMDHLDQGSYRLLPLLYQNLHDHGVKGHFMHQLREVYLLTWCSNHILFPDFSAVLAAFHNASIETMILKGAALTLLHYKSHALRPVGDFDVLVRTEQASEAVDLLTKMGWNPIRVPGRRFDGGLFSVRHAWVFEDAAGHQLDLHRHLLPEFCYEDADGDFWDGAMSTQFHGVSTSALNPTDALLHVCVHGTKWSPVPPLRWVADAMMIIDSSHTEIDWDRFITQARERRLTVPLGAALNYLGDLLDAPIPAAVLRSMRQIPVSRIERMEYRVAERPPGWAGGLPRHWFRYLHGSQRERGACLRPKLYDLPGFLRFLQRFWGLSHVWQIPFYSALKGMRLILGRVGCVRGSLGQGPVDSAKREPRQSSARHFSISNTIAPRQRLRN